jgi:hypothetical protein
MLSEPTENAGYLFGGLALTENDFRHALAKGAVMIDLGKSQVFEGQVAEAVDGVVGRELLLSDLVEEFAERR